MKKEVELLSMAQADGTNKTQESHAGGKLPTPKHPEDKIIERMGSDLENLSTQGAGYEELKPRQQSLEEQKQVIPSVATDVISVSSKIASSDEQMVTQVTTTIKPIAQQKKKEFYQVIEDDPTLKQYEGDINARQLKYKK